MAAFQRADAPVGTSFFMELPSFPDSPYLAECDFPADVGRAGVTKNDADEKAWRLPGLRNLVHAAPYFYNGQVHTIGESVRVMAITQSNTSSGDEQVTNVLTFHETLSGPFPSREMRRLPPTPGDLID